MKRRDSAVSSIPGQDHQDGDNHIGGDAESRHATEESCDPEATWDWVVVWQRGLISGQLGELLKGLNRLCPHLTDPLPSWSIFSAASLLEA